MKKAVASWIGTGILMLGVYTLAILYKMFVAVLVVPCAMPLVRLCLRGQIREAWAQIMAFRPPARSISKLGTYRIERSLHRHDGDTEIRLSAYGSTEHHQDPFHATCRITGGERSNTTLCSAFSINAYNAAIPDDLAGQEQVNTVLEEAIRRCYDARPALAVALIEQLGKQWCDVRARLEQRWQTSAEGGGIPPGFGTIMPAKVRIPVLAMPATLPGETGHLAVYRTTDGSYKRWTGRAPLTIKTANETIKDNPRWSGHEKLQFLGQLKSEYPDAVAVLDAQRKATLQNRPLRPDKVVFPLRNTDLLAFRDAKGRFDYLVRTAEGETVSFKADRGRYYDIFAALSMIMKGERGNTVLTVMQTSNTPSIEPGVRDALSVATLNDDLRKLLEIFLALDDVIPRCWIVPDAPPAPADHPVLRGLHVPPRHGAFINTLLDEPYRAAVIKASGAKGEGRLQPTLTPRDA